GDQVQNGLLAVDHQGMARVVATLITHNSCSLLGQEVDDFAFAIIAPLGAQDYDILTHNTNPLHANWMSTAADGNISGRRSGCQRSQLPAAITQQQLTITTRRPGISRSLARQRLHHALTVLA